MVVNSIDGKIEGRNEIINPVEDVNVLSHFSVSRVEYCNKITNRMTDVLVKKTLTY